MELIDYMSIMIALMIGGVYGTSAYMYFKEKREKACKKKCQMDKYHR